MIKKVVSIFFLALITGFIILGFALQTETARNYAKITLTEIIHAKTGYRLEINDIRLYPSFQLKILDSTLFDNDLPLISFENLYLGIHPLSLIEGNIHLSSLRIEGLKTHNTNRGESSFSFEEIPMKLEIDHFDIQYMAETSPMTVKGDLYLNANAGELSTHAQLFPGEEREKWISADISYKDRKGAFKFNSTYNATLEGEYILTDDAILSIPHFYASSGIFSVDGNLSISKEGKITDSTFSLSSKELSEILPATGYIRGEGTISGPILTPEVNLALESDSIVATENTFEKIKINITSRQTQNGLKGNLDLSFLKNKEPHSFSGKFYSDETIGPLSTHIKATTNLTEIAQLFAIDFLDMEGKIDLDFEISTRGLTAHAELSNGVFESYEFGTLLTNVHASVIGDLHTITIKGITAGDGNGGKFTGKGTCLLDPKKGFPLDLAFEMKKAAIVVLDNTKIVANGKFTIKGPSASPKLAGDVATQSIRITLPEKLPALRESLEVIYINQPPGAEKPTSSLKKGGGWPLELDIKLSVPGKAKVKGRGLNSEWKGEVAITGTPKSPLVNGEFKVVDGKYSLRGKTFKLTQGTVTLAGNPMKKTTLYIIAEIKIDRIVAEAIVKGPLTSLNISLRSNPPMSKKEILSWLLFNRGISDISPFQGTQLNESITMLSAEPDEGPDIMSRVSSTLGLDRFEIGAAPGANSADVSIKVGKYLTDSTYVTFARKNVSNKNNASQTADANCVGIETSLGKNFTLQAEVDDDSGGQVNLLWKKDY